MNEAFDKKLVILTGPTAVGKSELAVQLAKEIGGEIISADSMQVYRHMDIGSAKILPEEMEGIPHHLIMWSFFRRWLKKSWKKFDKEVIYLS